MCTCAHTRATQAERKRTQKEDTHLNEVGHDMTLDLAVGDVQHATECHGVVGERGHQRLAHARHDVVGAGALRGLHLQHVAALPLRRQEVPHQPKVQCGVVPLVGCMGAQYHKHKTSSNALCAAAMSLWLTRTQERSFCETIEYFDRFTCVGRQAVAISSLHDHISQART